MCEGKRRQRLTSAQRTGSPPRMRGKVSGAVRRGAAVGITPAHAGKRSWQSLRTKPARDHPRTCGEKAGIRAAGLGCRGLPPHMRGKALREAAGGLFQGITPAYAGKRAAACRTSPAVQDHPRVCGEKSMYDYGNNTAQGSPPHVRGKVLEITAYSLRERITPACAGKRYNM